MSLEIKSGTNRIYVSSKCIRSKNSRCAAVVGLKSFTPQQIAQLVHELSALAWISVEDELPGKSDWYQCKDVAGNIHHYYFNVVMGFETDDITHWQPMAKLQP